MKKAFISSNFFYGPAILFLKYFCVESHKGVQMERMIWNIWPKVTIIKMLTAFGNYL